MKIGFIGLGVMGTPMARHLAKAGHRLTLLDLDDALTRALARDLGATAAATPADVARASDVIVTMLPDGRAVQQVVLGDARRAAGRASPARCCWTPRRPNPG
jgi:3-hydroxyisobutyrate dehydrogenase-like beta-hydroxyacid dehydrogenase